MKILRGDLEIYEIKDYKQVGRFMEVAYIECTIESPTPIDFQIGDKVIFDYNNLPYTIYDTPSIKKQARARSYGKAFVYELKFKADTEQLDICPFLDIVPNDNNVHYTSLPSFSTFEDVYGIAARIQANMDYLYPNQWIIRVASTTDAELSETLSEAKEFSVSSESCLDALKKIYDTWGVSFIHTVEDGKNVITIGKSAGTTGLFQYGLNQGLRTIKKSIQNPDQLCTRLYAFGSTRNVPARWYNQNGYIGESQYAPHLMLPPSVWKGNSPKGAYIDAIFGNGDNRIEKYGLRIKTFVYDGTNGREEIYPSVHGITAKNIREAKAELGETKYVPSTSRYPNASRMDSVLTGSNISDNGTAVDDGYELYSQKTEVHVSLVSGQVNMAPQNGVLTVVHDIDICTFDITKAAVYRLSEIDGAVFLLKNDIYSNVTAQLYIRKPDGNLIKLPEEKIFKDTINALVGIPEYGFQANISGSYKLFVRVSIDWTDVSFADTILPEEGFSLKWDVLENNISIARGENILNPQFNISIKQIGFNLNDVTASDNSKKTIHFLTGMCSGRTFEIDQCEYSESNDSWNLTCRRVDDSEVSQRFPNKTFRVKAGDQFVLLNINMPDLYVYTAMQRLYDAALKDLKYYSTPQYVIEPEIDNIKMLRSPQVVKEGMYMPIQDSDISLQDDILIDSVTITNKGNESRKFEVALRNDKIYNRFNKIATQLADLESSNKVSAQESARTPASDNTIEIVPDYVRRIEQLENLFGVDANGDVYVKTKDAETPRNFYTLGEISSGGVGELTEGGNGIATILDAAKLGTIATEDLSQTFSAYAVDSIYKQVQAIIQGGVGGGGGLTKELADTYYAPLDYFNNGIAKKATLLENAPVLKKYTDTSITVTAGGQESSAFVVPFATTAGSINIDGVYTIWGKEYWKDGKPQSVSGDLDLGDGSLKVGGTAVIEKDTTIKGILHLKSALIGAEGKTLDWYGDVYGDNIRPQSNATYNLGGTNLKWKNAYVSDLIAITGGTTPTLQIGDALLYWDKEKNSLRTNANFFAEGELSSGLIGEDESIESGINITVLPHTVLSTYGAVEKMTEVFSAYATKKLSDKVVMAEENISEIDLKVAKLSEEIIGQYKEVNYSNIGTQVLEYAFAVKAGDVVYYTTTAGAPYGVFVLVRQGTTKVQETYTYSSVSRKEFKINYDGDLYVRVDAGNTNPLKVIVEGEAGEIQEIKENILSIETDLQSSLDKKIEGKFTENLFNKNTITEGFYVIPGNGTLKELAGYCASDYIEVEEGEVYSATLISNSAYYDAEKKYVSGVSGSPITIPANVRYIRLTISLSAAETFMFNKGATLLPYVEFGLKLQPTSFGNDVLDYLKEKLNVDDINLSYFESLGQHLSNPFIKTQIKFIGDSITAGVGGKGFSASDQPIPNSSTKTNVLTATCWTNMMIHNLQNVYGGEKEIDTLNPYVKHLGGYNQGRTYKGNVSFNNCLYTGNTISQDLVEFSFYGSSCKVRYLAGASLGMFDIYVDDSLYKRVDCYKAETDADMFETISVSEGNHLVLLRATGEKNESSSNKQLWITGLVLTKTIVFYPYGISGTQSSSGKDAQRYSREDDFVLIQYGTNDRFTNTSANSTYTNLKSICEMLTKDYAAKPIILCSCPASETQETTSSSVTYYYHMKDVRNAIARLSADLGVPFVDNYGAYIKYAEQHDITINELLVDGLHPNDKGYRVMYANIMETLGLTRPPYYEEWLGE